MSMSGQQDALAALQATLRTFGAEMAAGASATAAASDPDELMSVEVVGGRLSTVAFSPLALRGRTNADLAELVRITVNDALERSAARPDPPEAGAAFRSLLGAVEQIAAQAERDLERTTATMDRALDSVERLAAEQAARQRAAESRTPPPA